MDVLIIVETKLDSSFPKSQFKIPGYSNNIGLICHLAREVSWCWSMISCLLTCLGEIAIVPAIQILPVELDLHSKKWLLLPIYKPPKQCDSYFREDFSRVVDFYSRTYDSVLVIGDFNMEVKNLIMRTMVNDHNFSSLIQTTPCFKSIAGRCIDLTLTNNKNGCFNTKTFETGFNDFHYMFYINLKATYTRLPPMITRFRSYQYFSQEQFRAELAQKLTNYQTDIYEDRQQIYLDTLNKFAPLKQSPFVAIMHPICLRTYGKP